MPIDFQQELGAAPDRLGVGQAINEGIYGEQIRNTFTRALAEYPVLQSSGVGFKASPNRGKGFLEFWPAQEPGAHDFTRPSEFPMGTVGVEVYNPKTRPIDILGDVVSHHLVKTDPYLKKTYQDFESSLTPQQHEDLQRQYRYAQQHFKERRPYADWYQSSGLPGYFRGGPFQQWENPQEIYTPGQLQSFEQMMQYLRSPR